MNYNQVRNEAAEDFLLLLKEWKKLCTAVGLIQSTDRNQPYLNLFNVEDGESEDDEGNDSDDDEEVDGEVFEVEKILAICYGDPKEKNEKGLYLKVI